MRISFSVYVPFLYVDQTLMGYLYFNVQYLNTLST